LAVQVVWIRWAPQEPVSPAEFICSWQPQQRIAFQLIRSHGPLSISKRRITCLWSFLHLC